jgi:hypothetical protein
VAVVTNRDKTGVQDERGEYQARIVVFDGAFQYNVTLRGTYVGDITSTYNADFQIPSAAACAGMILRFVRYGASNTFTITRDGSDKINNVAANYTLSGDKDCVVLQSDGVDNWLVIGQAT